MKVPSLAQRGDWKQQVDEFEKVISRVSDSVDDLTAQPDRNPMINLAGMRQKDDLRNLGLVSAQVVIPATGLAGPKLAAEFRSVTLAFRATQVQLSETLSYGITYNINKALAAPITFAAQAGELYFYGAGISFTTGFTYPDIGNTPLGSPGDMIWWANQGSAARNAWDQTFGGP